MRIGVIAPPWLPVPPPAYGGTESAIDLLARGLDAAGHDVVLVTTGDSTCPVERAWVYESAEWMSRGSSAELRHVVYAYDVVRDCDVVHDHTLVGPVYAADRVTPPVVTTVHSLFNAELVDIYRAVADRVAIIAISRCQAENAGLPIAAVIHHAVDTAATPMGSGDGGYVLFLGRMGADKGAHRAARAARAAGTKLIIAAKMREPAERVYFEQHVAPLLGPGVEFVGEVDRATKTELLCGARALVNPIRWREPFGMVMIEALACGTPVLAFPEGAAPEIVEDGVNGFLCADEERLAARIADAAQLDRNACRASAAARFSVERMVARHVELYERLTRELAAA
ncbi:MAG: glycosyltransferase family 4 protein [Actinobacteria bacterium]|nr:MAG: glycosyltransferase family 4 protein [Actinomycetota bacterium]